MPNKDKKILLHRYLFMFFRLNNLYRLLIMNYTLINFPILVKLSSVCIESKYVYRLTHVVWLTVYLTARDIIIYLAARVIYYYRTNMSVIEMY